MNEFSKPKVWKMMLLSWLFVYPVVSVISALLFPLTKDFHPLLRSLIFSVILVPIMGTGIPAIHRKCWSWITK